MAYQANIYKKIQICSFKVNCVLDMKYTCTSYKSSINTVWYLAEIWGQKRAINKGKELRINKGKEL